jgi:hypothetical protein
MPNLLQGFTAMYRGRQIKVGIVHHPRGLSARVQVDQTGWQYDETSYWPTCDEAAVDGIAFGQRLIDQIAANDERR